MYNSRRVTLFTKVRDWIVKQSRKRKNTYVVKDSATNQYLDTIYAKTTKKVMKIFTRRFVKGSRPLYKKRYSGSGVIIENRDWQKSLKE